MYTKMKANKQKILILDRIIISFSQLSDAYKMHAPKFYEMEFDFSVVSMCRSKERLIRTKHAFTTQKPEGRGTNWGQSRSHSTIS